MSPVSQSVQTHLPCHCSCQRKSQIPAPFSNVIKVKLLIVTVAVNPLSLLVVAVKLSSWFLVSSLRIWRHSFSLLLLYISSSWSSLSVISCWSSWCVAAESKWFLVVGVMLYRTGFPILYEP